MCVSYERVYMKNECECIYIKRKWMSETEEWWRDAKKKKYSVIEVYNAKYEISVSVTGRRIL